MAQGRPSATSRGPISGLRRRTSRETRSEPPSDSCRPPQPDRSSTGRSPTGAPRSLPVFSVPPGTGRGSAPLAPPPGVKTQAPGVSLSRRPSRGLPPDSGRPPLPGGGPRSHARPRLRPRGRAAGLLLSRQLGPHRNTLRGQNGGLVAFRTGPQCTTFARALSSPEMACFYCRFLSAPPERGN
ncbi:hypothetical protein NDU88_001686 [Pleurodeles waltl]|uniref:Uncharacterized protein n=1 Tax=Pleurodeles waltl TaxID=8319 RepID=A0AAV7M171_PLEWA|nr:hypothetical protein NDU88_001686 [Pleurodeles waltl]